MDIKTELHEVAYRAYSNMSFDPERRRDQILKELDDELQSDLAELGENAGNYEEKYIQHARTWLERKSRCISVMITGPANFPVRRNQKANAAEDKAWTDFQSWRSRYFKAVNRVSMLSPEDDMDIAIKRLDKILINQELMKSANRIIRKKLTDDEKIAEMAEAGLSEELAASALKPDCFGDLGFPSYTLRNNNATIKRMRNKVETMKRRITVKADFKPILFPGGSITIEADRVCIHHDEKPERDVIDKIKSRGFHWSRNHSCWSRKHTARALIDAREIVGV